MSGTSATAAVAQFLFDQASGALRWDADGTGAVVVAFLGPGTALAGSDLRVIA